MKTLHIIVNGRVQGVGFRFHAQMMASANDLTGWVKNREDGSVEIMAQGENKQLEDFLKDLKKGNRYAKVDDMSVKGELQSETFSEFKIVH
ncbi:acylphosphatase [Metabacillus idriensis]|uniref:acylphosphatase n=1 Tax=Metabacillus idriensis TaxID=324768 RepID=UPI0017493A69|nr:acylphosphatase [Metabacillus idriensis]